MSDKPWTDPYHDLARKWPREARDDLYNRIKSINVPWFKVRKMHLEMLETMAILRHHAAVIGLQGSERDDRSARSLLKDIRPNVATMREHLHTIETICGLE